MKPYPRCYHCDEAIPQGTDLKAKVAGRLRIVCSQNCLTTAEWIDQTGLADYYRLRSGPNQRFNKVDNSHWQNSDRKSTRLNSSHVRISYAVFCLKKKIKQQHPL